MAMKRLSIGIPQGHITRSVMLPGRCMSFRVCVMCRGNCVGAIEKICKSFHLSAWVIRRKVLRSRCLSKEFFSPCRTKLNSLYMYEEHVMAIVAVNGNIGICSRPTLYECVCRYMLYEPQNK